MNGLLAAALIAVYSHYPSGRPHLVVKATHDPDELLLLRYADAPHARPRVVAREELDSQPGEVRLERVIDPKDVVVSLTVRHGKVDFLRRLRRSHRPRRRRRPGEHRRRLRQADGLRRGDERLDRPLEWEAIRQ
jgi:hypothetical protein